MVRSTYVPPSTTLKAFSCPHCGALTTQHWRRALVSYSEKDSIPFRISDKEEFVAQFRNVFKENQHELRELPEWIDRVATGIPSIGTRYEKSVAELYNVDISECYHCDKIAIWVGYSIAWPRQRFNINPNPDLPTEISQDFLEAAEILDASPRGSAALLRLCIQKLCIHLGEPGKNLYDDIGALAKKGLDPKVQQMLDTLRVFGNSAVHPGELDLKDDRSTAEKLFSLVNMIVDVMISQPKIISDLYGKLGNGQIDSIDRRDIQKSD